MFANGGVISGSGMYGRQALNENPAATIIIPTALRITSDIISSFTGITCLYDKYWYNDGKEVTFPVCFFFVKKLVEVQSADTSQLRVLMYEAQSSLSASELGNPLRKGAMQVIADNIVKKPKTYNMEVILPFMPISSQFVMGANVATSLIQGMVDTFTSSDNALSLVTSATSSMISIVQKAVEAAKLFPPMSDAMFVNKNSLDAMFRNQRVLTMKMWSGFQYKYVVITNLTVEKMPLEDDVFRATLQLVELPILSISAPKTGVTAPANAINKNVVASIINQGNELLLKPLTALTGVESETVAGKLVTGK